MRQSFEELLESAGPIDVKALRTIKPNGRGIIFIPTNGAGLGHLTRLLAIAKRLKKRILDTEIIFFTTSLAKHLIIQEGFIGYYFPTKTLFDSHVTASRWNNLFLKQLSDILKYHNPQMLVFDGTFPYLGLIQSMNQLDLKKIWIKREGSKVNDSDKRGKEKEKFFDFVITPREAGLSTSEDTGRIYCNPIIYLEKSELLDRSQLLKQWKVPENSKVVYIQLGAGNINNITNDITVLIQNLKQRKEIFIVIGESIIGKKLKIPKNNVMILRDYPNSQFFKAFDLAICASGYNSFHELMHFGVPSIFIPNRETIKDDQFGRAMRAVQANAGMILENLTPESINNAVEISLNNRDPLSKNAMSLVPDNGADSVAQFIAAHCH
ncbi:glycosyltransferase [Phosphitispora fastidiosa]|uniref:glycosyltransferase n=1 Tax=Phosphitispora fastidiosa TaxID=2837202 RepID=UPI001E4E1296|nr:glycosyltransferase [Phosphitispora fastidiosa]MBU7008554.1 UDP:flavonoid glycosyltransferase YjiC (YdhE family) [Phosphitispora fastidiosa]